MRILEREIINGMRLLGVRKVEELTPEMVRVHSISLSFRPDMVYNPSRAWSYLCLIPPYVTEHVLTSIRTIQVERVDWEPLTAKL